MCISGALCQYLHCVNDSKVGLARVKVWTLWLFLQDVILHLLSSAPWASCRCPINKSSVILGKINKRGGSMCWCFHYCLLLQLNSSYSRRSEIIIITLMFKLLRLHKGCLFCWQERWSEIIDADWTAFVVYIILISSDGRPWNAWSITGWPFPGRHYYFIWWYDVEAILHLHNFPSATSV